MTEIVSEIVITAGVNVMVGLEALMDVLEVSLRVSVTVETSVGAVNVTLMS